MGYVVPCGLTHMDDGLIRNASCSTHCDNCGDEVDWGAETIMCLARKIETDMVESRLSGFSPCDASCGVSARRWQRCG